MTETQDTHTQKERKKSLETKNNANIQELFILRAFYAGLSLYFRTSDTPSATET